jgi:branched-chain amino acid transport system ATP-binding protein
VNRRLIVNNIYASYGEVKVLHGVSMHLEPSEILVLLGTNGNGKSTLIKCIMGMEKPDSGEIYLESNSQRIDLIGKSPEEIVNLGISLVPEGRRLFPLLTVEENLLLGCYRKDARKTLKGNLQFNYKAFPILKERRKQLAGTLSGGEQQMLTVARALMSNPEILLIDEASQGLAPVIIRDLMLKIKELKDQRRLTVFMTEQNFNQAVKIADRGYIIVHGKIEFEGHNKEQLSENEMIKRYYLGSY